MWFSGCTTVEAAKALYRTLAKQYHPDRGGDTATMQEINDTYHRCLSSMDGQVSRDSAEREHTYRYDSATEQAAMDKIAELLRIRGDFEIYLIGTWVWVMGDTKPIKDALKAAGCQWHSKRLCWYWRPDTARHYGKMSRNGLGFLAARYGYQEFSSAGEQQDYALA